MDMHKPSLTHNIVKAKSGKQHVHFIMSNQASFTHLNIRKQGDNKSMQGANGKGKLSWSSTKSYFSLMKYDQSYGHEINETP